MLRRIQTLVRNLANETAGSDWTLLAVSFAASAAIVSALRALFG
jgi:hypothetical protein